MIQECPSAATTVKRPAPQPLSGILANVLGNLVVRDDPPAGTQYELPLTYAPQKVRAHGLRDAHTRPLVGRRARGGRFRSWRTSPELAWLKPYLELHAANTYVGIIVDCDDPDAGFDALAAGTVPEFSYCVTNKETGHHHLVWLLARPVHRYPEARIKPLKAYRRIVDYYTATAGGDPGFAGVLTRNPMSWADRHTSTTWNRRDPYSLAEAAEVIPLHWRRPLLLETGVGRNVDLYEALMRWAGSLANAGIPVLPEAIARNQQFSRPLPISEVQAIARSVEKSRAVWAAHDWHTPKWLELQAARGRMGKGKPRQASLFDYASNEETRPWEAEGVSRATWYRRRSEDRETEANADSTRLGQGVAP